jgi:hypothetical protein
MKLFPAVSLGAILLFLSLPMRGQDQHNPKPIPVEIEKKDATRLSGKLLGIDRDTVSLRTDDQQEIRISMRDIRHIDYIDSLRTKPRWPEAPNTTRYLLAPTAWPLKKGEMALENSYLLVNVARVGITNSISVAGGGDLLFGNVYTANVKATLWQKPMYKMAGSVHYYKLPRDFIVDFYGNDIRDIAMLSVINSWGNSNRHISISLGYLYAQRDFLPPTATVSGSIRVFRQFALVSENWLLDINETDRAPIILSVGVRFVKNSSSTDIGVYTDSKSLFGISLPYVGYTYKFQL